MTLAEFARLVYRMRRAQRAAQWSYSMPDIVEAVGQEYEVDAAIMRILEGIPMEGEDDLPERD